MNTASSEQPQKCQIYIHGIITFKRTFNHKVIYNMQTYITPCAIHAHTLSEKYINKNEVMLYIKSSMWNE